MTEDERKTIEAEIELLEVWVADIERGAVSYEGIANVDAVDNLLTLIRQKRSRLRKNTTVAEGRPIANVELENAL